MVTSQLYMGLLYGRKKKAAFCLRRDRALPLGAPVTWKKQGPAPRIIGLNGNRASQGVPV